MKIFVFIFLTIFSVYSFAQNDSNALLIAKDSLAKTDSIHKKNIADSLLIVKDSIKKREDSLLLLTQKNNAPYSIFYEAPILNNSSAEYLIVRFKNNESKDILFYSLLGVVLLFSITKIIFPRYINNIFGILFQTPFRQIQTREQITQNNASAFLLNILFIISTSFFIALLAQKFHWTMLNVFQSFLYCTILMSIIYTLKIAFISFVGFIFQISTAAKSYKFIVFIANKIIGIFLIPFLFLIAFSTAQISFVSIKMAVVFIAIILFFRLFLTYKSLSSILKINAIHFFLYFCTIEILPLLLMFKFLNNLIM